MAWRSHKSKQREMRPPRTIPRDPSGFAPRTFWAPPLRSLILEDVEPFEGAVAIIQTCHRPTHATPKARPAVLAQWREDTDTWQAWPLTSLAKFADGLPRFPAHGANLAGLSGDDYIWGGNRVELAPDQVLGVVWAAPPELILACARAESGKRIIRHPEDRVMELHLQHLEAGWSWPRPRCV